MYKLVVFLLNSVLVSVAVEVFDHPVATSYSFRADGQKDGYRYGSGYKKKYGFAEVVVTTYYVPKLVPTASYSTYIIHPTDDKQFGYNEADNTHAASVPQFEIESENDAPIWDGSAEETNIEDKPGFEEKPNEYQKMVEDAYQELLKEWYKGDGSNTGEYWDKLKQNFDAYYEDQYNKIAESNNDFMKRYFKENRNEEDSPNKDDYDYDGDSSNDAFGAKYGYQIDQKDSDDEYDFFDQYKPKW